MSESAASVERAPDLRPASFGVHQAPVLTKGQRLILELLRQSLDTGLPITRRDISQCWIDAMCKNGMRAEPYMDTVYIPGTGSYAKVWKYRPVPANPEGYTEKVNGMAWFKNNLGACIIKGRLLAIPVIEA